MTNPKKLRMMFCDYIRIFRSYNIMLSCFGLVYLKLLDINVLDSECFTSKQIIFPLRNVFKFSPGTCGSISNITNSKVLWMISFDIILSDSRKMLVFNKLMHLWSSIHTSTKFVLHCMYID